MKLNKYILPIALAVSALSFCSCNDFLDRHPQGQFTEDDNPGALAEGKVFNIYTMMRNITSPPVSPPLPSNIPFGRFGKRKYRQ